MFSAEARLPIESPTLFAYPMHTQRLFRGAFLDSPRLTVQQRRRRIRFSFNLLVDEETNGNIRIAHRENIAVYPSIAGIYDFSRLHVIKKQKDRGAME